LAGAGGLGERADAHKVQIIRREGAPETVDVAALIGQAPVEAGAAAPQDPLLQPGDTVIVPRRYARVVVLGAVKDQGSYDFEEGDTVTEAIAQAGGFDPKAVMRGTSVLRREGDVVKVFSVNMRSALRGSEALLSEPLEDRDVVYVPLQKEPMWRDLSSMLFGLSNFVRVFVP
jgi:protein involved in polysaccharide export with SLBB domain